MTLRVAGVVTESIVDGPGFRLAVFTQGCPHRCEACHNPHTWDPFGGCELPVSDIAEKLSNPLLAGLTLTGGEPFCQPAACAALAREAHALGLTVWTYTGYTYDVLLADADPDGLALLRETDVLVDGPFVLALRTLNLLFRGSSNQRVLDVPRSLAAGRAVEIVGCGDAREGPAPP